MVFTKTFSWMLFVCCETCYRELEDGADLTVTAAEFKVWTIISLQMLFGEVCLSQSVFIIALLL